MSLVQRSAAAPLAGAVRSYYGFEETTPEPMRRREGPGPEAVVIVSFGNEWRIGDAVATRPELERLTSFVGGLRGTSVVTEHDGWSAGMQVNLHPAAARMLFRRPMSDLADATVPLDALLPQANLLVERLATAQTWGDRFAILDSEIARRLADAPRPSSQVLWVWSQLGRSRGRVPVSALAEELGWSRRRLVGRFRDEIGLPPKTVARLFRFEHACELARDGASWVNVAFAAGYYDQPHLINEFRAITGVTPPVYATTNLQDGAEVAA